MKANIFISGPIGYPSGEYAEDSGTTLVDVRRQLESFPEDIDGVNVFINSPGGEVTEGFAIYDYLRALGVPVTTIGEGMVYSIASIIFAAGSERLLYENAEVFMHDPIAGIYGNSRDMREAAEFLDSAGDKIVNAYLSVMDGSSREDVLSLMEAETFLKAQDAITLGIATGIYSRKVEPVAWYKTSNLPNSNMSDKKTVLEEIKSLLKAANEAPATEAPAPEAVEATETVEEVSEAEKQLEALTGENEALKAELAALRAENAKTVEDAEAAKAEYSKTLNAINARLEILETVEDVATPAIELVVSNSDSGRVIPENLADKDSAIFEQLKKFK